MTLLVLFASAALGISFLCSILEAVLLSITPSYVAHAEEAQLSGARTLRALKNDVDRPLAAILSLNTIANTAGATGVGAQVQAIYGDQYLALASFFLTLGILIFSEIIPKTLGALHWRRLAPFAAAVLPVLILMLYPLVLIAERLTRVMSEDGSHGNQRVSSEELQALARLGAEQGIFGESESRILRNLFLLGQLRARDVMTPRPVVFMLPETLTIRELLDRQEGPLVFSRIPVFGENGVDDVTGYVLKDELLLQAAWGKDGTPLSAFRRELLVLPDSLPLPALFERLLNRREHIALVVDEYGGMAGVLTSEDVVETLLGLEIVDEADRVEDMRALARSRWFDRARRGGHFSDDALEAMSTADGPSSSPPPPPPGRG